MGWDACPLKDLILGMIRKAIGVVPDDWSDRVIIKNEVNGGLLHHMSCLLENSS